MSFSKPSNHKETKMKIPAKLPTCRSEPGGTAAAIKSVANGDGKGLSQAGCCASVCAPIVGCHCVAESPFC